MDAIDPPLLPRSARQPEHSMTESSSERRPDRHRGQGLSAAVGDLHRPGDPGAGAAGPAPADRLAAPSDRHARCTTSTAAITAPVLYLPEYLYQEPAAGARRRALGPAPAGLCRTPCRLPPRLPARPDAEPLAAASARPACWRSELPPETVLDPRPFPAHPGLGRPLRRADPRPALERLGPRQGHLDDAGVGDAREAGRGPLGRHLHRGRTTTIWRAGAGAGRGCRWSITASISAASPTRSPGRRRDGRDPTTRCG